MRQRPKITGANAGKRPGFAENTRVGRSPRPGVAQFHRWLRHEVAVGTAWRSNFDQALRVAAGIPRKHAPDGQRLGGRYCQGCGAFPEMYQTW